MIVENTTYDLFIPTNNPPSDEFKALVESIDKSMIASSNGITVSEFYSLSVAQEFESKLLELV